LLQIWTRQDLRARVNTYHISLNPDVKDGGANLRPGGLRCKSSLAIVCNM
jgi:hypothetical protein